MINSIEFGTTTPINENCAQLGSENYSTQARQEIRAFISQLHRLHGTPPEGAHFKVCYCPHDFGTYLDLALVYDENDDSHVEWMLKVESELPESWDQTAIRELTEAGYFQTEVVAS